MLFRLRRSVRLRGLLANGPTGKSLHVLLLVLLCCSAFLPGAIAAWLAVTSISSLVFLRRGCLTASAWIFLTGTWMLNTAVIVLSGGILSPTLPLYLALPISAAWLLGPATSLWTAAACLGAVLGLTLIENFDVALPSYFPEMPPALWAALLAPAIISTVSVAHAMKVLKQALARSETAQADFRAAAQTRNNALAGMSHKLRTSLNAILGFSNLVREDTGISPEHRGDLDIVARKAEHLLTLIDEVLDVSRLPAEPAPRTHRQVLGLSPNQPGFRILIVEDTRENGNFLQRMLLDAGFQVRTAGDGLRAIDEFRAWRPHFIWMDLRLPTRGGPEAARKIRTLEGGAEVRIVALTVSPFCHQRAELLSSGFDDFLSKPYRRHEIFDCLSRHLVLRYRYRETLPPSAGDTGVPLLPEALKALPSDLRSVLSDALVRLEPDPIAEAIHRVTEHDSQLGRILTHYSERLAYAQILDALELEYGLAGGA
uniref:histidine kinase n=1 Tax=Solibacter usitatus (strain Ellin6076) TaxID=234267 RepID=Q023Q1_SOLUE